MNASTKSRSLSPGRASWSSVPRVASADSRRRSRRARQSNLDDTAVGETAALRFDLTVDAAAPRLVAAAADALGGLDGVGCCDGVVAVGPLDDTLSDVLQEIVAVDLVVPLLLARGDPRSSRLRASSSTSAVSQRPASPVARSMGSRPGCAPVSNRASWLSDWFERSKTKSGRPRERLHAVTRLPDLDDERHERRPDDR